MRHILRLIFVTYNFCDLLMSGFKKFVYHSIGYLLRVIPTGMPNLLYKFQSLLGCSFNGQASRLWCGPLLHVCNFESQFFFFQVRTYSVLADWCGSYLSLNFSLVVIKNILFFFSSWGCSFYCNQ